MSKRPSIWTVKGRVEDLVEIYVALRNALDRADEKFLEDFEGFGIDKEKLPTSTQLRNFRSGAQHALRDPRRYDGWFEGVVFLLNDKDVREAVSKEILEKLERLRAAYGSVGGQGTAGHQPHSLASLIAHLCHHLQIDHAHLSALWRFFQKGEGAEVKKPVNFLLYRYHSRPGWVAKSHFRISPPSLDAPFMTFRNTFCENCSINEMRITDGVIVPMSAACYFVGRMDHSAALKVMSIPGPYRRSEQYRGLLMSFDDYQRPICSRFVLKRTDIETPTSKNIGILHGSKIAEEIRPFESALRNRVDFTLTHPIRYRDAGSWRELSQAEMVEVVREKFLDGDKRPTLVDDQGLPFNPAADIHYPYNSVLGAYSDDNGD